MNFNASSARIGCFPPDLLASDLVRLDGLGDLDVVERLADVVDRQHPAVVFLHRGLQFGDHLPDAPVGPEAERFPPVQPLPEGLEGLVQGLADDAVQRDPDLQDPLLTGAGLGDGLLAGPLGPPLFLP